MSGDSGRLPTETEGEAANIARWGGSPYVCQRCWHSKESHSDGDCCVECECIEFSEPGDCTCSGATYIGGIEHHDKGCRIKPAQTSATASPEEQLAETLAGDHVRAVLLKAYEECMAARRAGKPFPDYLPIRRSATFHDSQKESTNGSEVRSDSAFRDGHGRDDSGLHREAQRGRVSTGSPDESQSAASLGGQKTPGQQEAQVTEVSPEADQGGVGRVTPEAAERAAHCLADNRSPSPEADLMAIVDFIQQSERDVAKIREELAEWKAMADGRLLDARKAIDENAKLRAELEDAWRNDHPITNDEAIRRHEDFLKFCYLIRDGEPQPAPATAEQPGARVYQRYDRVRVKSISEVSLIPNEMLGWLATVVDPSPDLADDSGRVEVVTDRDTCNWFVHPSDLEPAKAEQGDDSPLQRARFALTEWQETRNVDDLSDFLVVLVDDVQKLASKLEKANPR